VTRQFLPVSFIAFAALSLLAWSPPNHPVSDRQPPLVTHGSRALSEVARAVHAHPTLSEVMMEAAHAAATGQAIHI